MSEQHAEAHRLKNELGYGARRIGRELGISRYAAEQLLAQPLPQPVAEPVADEVRPVAEPVGQVADEVVEQAPTGPVLVLELDRFPGLAADLAVLSRTGRDTAKAAVQAVAAVATAYRTALKREQIPAGVPFFVTRIELRPASARRAA